MVIAALALSACSDDDPADPFLLYDDFTGATPTAVNATKWTSSVSSGSSVFVDEDFLKIDYVPDGSANHNARLFMADAGSPTTVTGIEAKMTVESWSVSGNVRLRLGGTFYNDGTIANSGAAGDFTSDIFAFIQVANTEVVAGVFRCTNSDCSGVENIVSGDVVGAVPVGTTATYRISYDSTTNVFTYFLAGALVATTNMVDTASGRNAPNAGVSIAGNMQVGIRGGSTPSGTARAGVDDFRCAGCVVP